MRIRLLKRLTNRIRRKEYSHTYPKADCRKVRGENRGLDLKNKGRKPLFLYFGFMDEQLLYLEEHISGVWDNADYTFVIGYFKNDSPNTISFINKHTMDKTGSIGSVYIVKNASLYVLRIIFTLENNKVNAMDFDINYLDAVTGILELSNNGMIITLKKA